MPEKMRTGGQASEEANLRELRKRIPWIALAALLGALASAPAAGAAYAPKLAVTVTPGTAGANPAIATSVTQALGEESTKRAEVGFPPSFGSNAFAQLAKCPQSVVDSTGDCPPGSRIGSAVAKSGLLTLTSGVFFGPPKNPGKAVFGLHMFLDDGIALTPKQHLVADVELRSSGIFSVLDDLPPLPVERFDLKLDGGTRSLATNPSTCGRKTFTGRFTSQGGTQATATSEVLIGGCARELLIEDMAIKPRSFRSKHRRGRSRRVRRTGTRIVYTLAENASARIAITTRRGKVLGFLSAPGSAGENTRRFSGRLRGHPLRRGRYRAVLRAVAGSRQETARRAFSVRR